MKTLVEYNDELCRRVLSVTLLGQLPYDETDLVALRDGLRPLFANGVAAGLRRVPARAELAFALYLVLEGTYNYCAGDYWAAPRDALALSGNFAAPIGEAFRRTLRRHALPTFEHLGGHAHVTPILAHVGIPDYCLPDFFDLLDRALRRDAAPDAATLMAEWGENDFPPAIDKPVQRFLRAGGPIAQDFVDRCLALWSPDANPTALALPRRVLRCFAGRPAGRAGRAHASGPRLVRPALTFDPYGEGPALALAPVVFPSGRAPARLVWHIVAGDRRREETAIRRRRGDGFEYTPRAAVNVLTVAPVYTITLLADDRPLQTWTLPGPADPPLLAFDPAGGAALPLGGDGPTGQLVLSPGERWLAYPRAWTPAPHGDARPLAELPDQPGDWAAFAFQTWRLGPGARLEFVAPDGRRAALRAHYDVPPPRPVLLGRRVAGDAPGAPALYGRPPDLLLPRHDRAEQPAAWHYAVEPIGPARPADARHGTLDALTGRLVAVDEGLLLPLDAPELLGDSPFGAFRLRLRGPYGRTADFELTCVPGLRLADYPRLYRGAADGPAAFTAVAAPGVVVAPAAPGVTAGPPASAADGRAWPIAVAADETSAALLFGGDGLITVEADVPIHRLRWGLRQPERPDRFAWSGRPLFLCPDELPARHTAELRVDRPFWGARPPPTGWRLVAPDGRVWREARPDDRRAGRYVTTALIDWLDATHEARGAACLQLLVAGEADEPLAVPVAVLRPTLDVGRVEADWPATAAGATLTLLWERDARLRARQLRLWPLDRPGAARPHVLPIPDEAEGCAEWSLPPGALPPEEYLGEMVVASPWGNDDAQRPEPDAPGVFVVRPAGFEGVLAARVAAVGRGQATPEDALALLLGAVRRGQPEQLVAISRALSSRHATLPDELLRQWANAGRGCTPAYRLARAALFAPERVGVANPSAEQVAAWLDHLPPSLPQVGLYATLLPLATDDRRRLCRDELCRAGHAVGYAALLDDVGRGRIRLDEALALLDAAAEAAVDYLLAAAHASAPAVLRALLARRPTIKLIYPGSDVQTNVGYGVVTEIRDRRDGRAVAACRNAPAQPYTLHVTLSPSSAPVSARIDLQTRRVELPEPVYKCRHNGQACQRVFGSADELTRHYVEGHGLTFAYIVERKAIPPLPLNSLHIMPPDGVNL